MLSPRVEPAFLSLSSCLQALYHGCAADNVTHSFLRDRVHVIMRLLRDTTLASCYLVPCLASGLLSKPDVCVLRIVQAVKLWPASRSLTTRTPMFSEAGSMHWCYATSNMLGRACLRGCSFPLACSIWHALLTKVDACRQCLAGAWRDCSTGIDPS